MVRSVCAPRQPQITFVLLIPKKSTTYKESVPSTARFLIPSNSGLRYFSFRHISSQLLDTATRHSSTPDVGVSCEFRKHNVGDSLSAAEILASDLMTFG
jgi:hypothetical protein